MDVNKVRFDVSLNWNGEVHDFSTMAVSEKKALQNAFFKLATMLGITPSAVNNYYKEHQTGYKVEKFVQ